MEVNHRFKGFPWYQATEEQVLLGGLGGIGSYLSLLLVRANFNVIAFDFDIVDNHNLGCQLFPVLNSVGKTKTSLAYEVTKSLCINSGKLSCINEKFTIESNWSSPYMFSAFDNFTARKTFFNAWLAKTVFHENPIFIDGRLDGEMLQIYCVTKATANKYLETLSEDGLLTNGTVCTMQQTSHMGAMIASLMVSFFTNHLTNIVEGFEVRSVPYFYEFFVPLVNTETDFPVGTFVEPIVEEVVEELTIESGSGIVEQIENASITTTITSGETVLFNLPDLLDGLGTSEIVSVPDNTEEIINLEQEAAALWTS